MKRWIAASMPASGLRERLDGWGEYRVEDERMTPSRRGSGWQNMTEGRQAGARPVPF